MKTTRLATLAFLGTAPFLLCGSSELSARMEPIKPTPMGDGSIPIGKVRGQNIKDISVVVSTATESFALFPSASGTISVPSGTTPGAWVVTARGLDAHPITFTVNVALDQPSFFDLWLMPIRREGDVTTAQIRRKSDPVTLHVGQWYWFRTALTGRNPLGLWPSYWLDGQAGKIFTGGMFIATKPGDARLHSDTLGVHDIVNIKVLP